MRAQIEVIFEAARQSGCQALVLSAFGWGAFGHPPGTVAELFRTAVRERGGALQLVFFGILDDHNTGRRHNPEGNLGPFARTFRKNGFPDGLRPSGKLLLRNALSKGPRLPSGLCQRPVLWSFRMPKVTS